MNLLKFQRDPAEFRRALLVETDDGPRPFDEVLDPWQRADFEALDASWKATVTGKGTPPHFRAWCERPRGHAKTSDEAVMIAWALFASRRQLNGFGAAADKDQAGLLRNAVGRLLSLNPWLGSVLEVQNWSVKNIHTGSSLEILSSDAPSSYGLLPDFVVADELTHWSRRDLWDSLLSSAAKRARCLLLVITNAGVTDSWQYELREAIRSTWYFSRLEGPVASWITTDRLDEQRRLLPPQAFRRLWLNEWTSGAGDALTAEDIDAAFKPDLTPMPRRVTGWSYCAGLDLGVSRDASALCVLGVKTSGTPEEHARIRLCFTQLWRPPKGGRVNLQQIEDALVSLHERYKFQAVAYDPWQASFMSQRLKLSKLPMIEVVQNPSNLQKIATTLIETFADRRFDLYPEENLRRDLCRLRVIEKSYGFRLESPRDATGHGDMASAFSFAMLSARDIAGKPRKRKARVLTEDGWSRDETDYWARAAAARWKWAHGINPLTDEPFEVL